MFNVNESWCKTYQQIKAKENYEWEVIELA